MSPRKILTLVFLAALLGIGYQSMNAAPVLSDQSYSYHGGTKWHTNFSDAQTVAKEEDKPILVYFWTTWCTYCEDYNQNVYSDPAVRDHLDDFVLVAVNLDNDSPQASRLKQRYDATYPPQHVAITPQGDRLVKINGYAKKEAFIDYLERAQRRAEQ
ncbi:thioredoxin [Haladaptatus sp. W1]|uniref:thioredoxin family protein n=1 Tax=Haladaptatus sp. W1 TaxID=1897478 RepID=UPI000849D105|nr:thioredoxin family protein [Haladaptatus sp. W1]ODR83201.1 thioredoxin [Haladaptatus sp. W1]